jgi:hypothetical protein
MHEEEREPLTERDAEFSRLALRFLDVQKNLSITLPDGEREDIGRVFFLAVFHVHPPRKLVAADHERKLVARAQYGASHALKRNARHGAAVCLPNADFRSVHNSARDRSRFSEAGGGILASVRAIHRTAGSRIFRRLDDFSFFDELSVLCAAFDELERALLFHRLRGVAFEIALSAYRLDQAGALYAPRKFANGRKRALRAALLHLCINTHEGEL